MTVEDLTPEEWENRELRDREVLSKILPEEDWTDYKKGNWKTEPPAMEKLNHAVYEILTAPDGFKGELDWGSEIVPKLTLEEVVSTLFHAEERLKELREYEELYCEENE